MRVTDDARRYRAEIAGLLAQSVESTRDIERMLGIDGGWQESSGETGLASSLACGPGIACAVLLRKARLHAVAVLRANEASNLHSLAVQMRPALECAGQVVFIMEKHVIGEGDKALNSMIEYIDANLYFHLAKTTKGAIGKKMFREMALSAQAKAAELAGAPKIKTAKPKKKRARPSDKVAMLEDGKIWHDELSERFQHGRSDLKGPSRQGGVVSMDTVEDEMGFADFMNYLVRQMDVMNASAALCLINRKVQDHRVEETLAKARELREALKALGDAAAGVVVDMGGTTMVWCDRSLDTLRGIVRIHLGIDSLTRIVRPEEPDWILRLRKVRLHAMAISQWKVDNEAMHAIATEIRAAYVQLDAVWQCMPEEIRFGDPHDGWWGGEARSGSLATFDHPTPFSLLLSAGSGGFSGEDGVAGYVPLALRLMQLSVGYGFALGYLAKLLNAGEEADARVDALVAEALGLVQAVEEGLAEHQVDRD